eukprot:scaffold31004_cov27-Prasinocladus_malaysianus.AAC.1
MRWRITDNVHLSLAWPHFWATQISSMLLDLFYVKTLPVRENFYQAPPTACVVYGRLQSPDHDICRECGAVGG